VHEIRLRRMDGRGQLEQVSKAVQEAEARILDRARSVDWRGQAERLARAARSVDASRHLEPRTLRLTAVVAVVVAVVLLSAAWTIRAKPWTRSESLVAAAAETTSATTPAPVVQGLAPKQKLRTRTDEQPVAVTGRDFVDGMSVTISTPDGFVTTYGAESLTNVSPTRFTLRAVFNAPGSYQLVVRTPAGSRSNEVSFVVGR